MFCWSKIHIKFFPFNMPLLLLLHFSQNNRKILLIIVSSRCISWSFDCWFILHFHLKMSLSSSINTNNMIPSIIDFPSQSINVFGANVIWSLNRVSSRFLYSGRLFWWEFIFIRMKMKKEKKNILKHPSNEANDCTGEQMTKMKEIHQMWWAKTHESMWGMDVLIQTRCEWEQREIGIRYRKNWKLVTNNINTEPLKKLMQTHERNSK